MRLILLILFVGAVLSEEQITKEADKKVEEDVKDIKKSIEEPKSKTEKRDSSDQTGSYGLNTNDEPFKPMLASNTAAYEVAASATQQQVYYDKNQLTADEGANTKGTINRQAAGNAYRGPHSQVVYQQQQPQEQYQQQQQHQQNKQHLRIVGKNAGIQQNQPNILYAVPHNGAYNYERNPQQQPQQQQQYIQQHISVQQQPGQRGSQKQLQYVVAIPLSYLRQLQQQLLYEQQEQSAAASPTHLQVNKGQQIAHVAQQQQQQQLQQQQQPSYAIAGPLARDNYGAYRPFHRFSPAAVNDVANGQHQAIAPPLIPAAPAPPGYITQYIQIPASVLLAAAQTAQVQQRPLNIQHQSAAYQQPPQQQQHQQQLQHTQAQSPQLYYYQPQQHQHQFQQQPQLKQSQTSHALTSPPLYEYHTQQQPNQQHQALQHIPEYQHLQQQQQANVGKQQHQQQQRIEGVRHNANLSPSQHATIYEQEQAQLAAIHAQTHAQTHYSTLLHAHKQPTQELTAPQAQLLTQSPATGHKVVQAITPAQQQQHHQQHQASADPYEPVVHYNPQYVQHYQQQQQQQQRVKYQQSPHPQHRLQIQHPLPPHQQHQQHQQPPLVENINYLSYSQGIHGPTPLPFLRLPAAAGAGAVAPHMAPQPSQLTPYYNYNLISPAMHHQPFVSSALQPSFAPLGMPSKVTSFTNVLLQPFVGQHSSYHTSEMGSAASADSLPFFNHHTGGIHYGTHLYHPPTPATAIASNKQLNLGSASSKPAPRSAVAAVSTAGESKQIAAATTTSAKSSTTSAGSQTIVKYP